MLRTAHGIVPAVLTCLLVAGANEATAQAAKKSEAQDSRSEQVIEKVISTDDGSGAKTRRFRRVIKDGKVVRDADQESHTRRVVVVNGETVVDEETVNGKPVKPGSKKHIRVMGPGAKGHAGKGTDELHDLHEKLQDMLGSVRGDRENLHEHLMELRRLGEHDADSDRSSSSHRVVIVNGEKVVDEKTENGKPIHVIKGDDLSKHLRVEIERLMDEDLDDLPVRLHEELERSLKGVRELREKDLHERVRVQLHEDLKDLPSRVHEELGRTLKRDLGRIHEINVDVDDLHGRLESELRKIHEEFQGPEMQRVHEKIKKALERHGLDDFLEGNHGPIQIRVQKKEDAGKSAKPRPRGIKV